ncbi:MAG: hypothetical protein Fur0020_08210 [Thermodesulfovibrionia bacterium]
MREVVIYLLIIIGASMLMPFVTDGGVRDTKHNLSTSGPGEIKAISETEVCVFCHTPHNASPQAPLWNHDVTAVESYINYWSETLQAYGSEAEAPPIDGFSKLCLSCHDGTVALGAVMNMEEDIEMVTIPNIVEGGRLMPGARGYLGTDLSGSHPISFIFDEALVSKRNSQPNLSRLNWPINDPDVRLYPTQGGYGVQCSSCHDPHNTKAGPHGPPFWRKSTYDEVCLVCHESL